MASIGYIFGRAHVVAVDHVIVNLLVRSAETSENNSSVPDLNVSPRVLK